MNIYTYLNPRVDLHLGDLEMSGCNKNLTPELFIPTLSKFHFVV